MSNVQVIDAIALLLDDEDQEKENVQERSQWVRPSIAKRKTDGAFLHHISRAETRRCWRV